MDEDETREYVAALVTQQLNVPGFELQPEQAGFAAYASLLLPPWPEYNTRQGQPAFGACSSVIHAQHAALRQARTHSALPCARLPPPLQIFLVSARDALFARLVLCADPNPADEVMFRKIAFGKRSKGVTDPAIIK
jgi:hypothetical protein